MGERDLESRVRALELKVEALSVKIDMLINSNNNLKMILQYVTLPLLLIVAGLVGVKIAIPGLYPGYHPPEKKIYAPILI